MQCKRIVSVNRCLALPLTAYEDLLQAAGTPGAMSQVGSRVFHHEQRQLDQAVTKKILRLGQDALVDSELLRENQGW